MKQKLFIGTILVVGFLLPLFVPHQVVHNGSIGGQPFVLEVVDTEAGRDKGLSGRKSLISDHGMLFVYDIPGLYCFWMKDMNFPIDILWFDANKKLVHQKDFVLPESYPESYCTPTAAQYVVEIAAGVAQSQQFVNGTQLELVK
jgi:uncharacterized membrane protein (UPF0127 family)